MDVWCGFSVKRLSSRQEQVHLFKTFRAAVIYEGRTNIVCFCFELFKFIHMCVSLLINMSLEVKEVSQKTQVQI